MTAMLTRASQAVEDALASDDNHPDDIARAVLMAVRDLPDEFVMSAEYLVLDDQDSFPACIDAILAGDA